MAANYNTQLMDAYCKAAKDLLADISANAGEDYEPNEELDAAIRRVRNLSTAIISIANSMHPMRSVVFPGSAGNPTP